VRPPGGPPLAANYDPRRGPAPGPPSAPLISVAVLDDYGSVARGLGPWERLDGRAEVEFLSEHLTDEDALAALLEGFDVLVAMRERTPFPRSLLERLPALRLLVTTGMANASIDLDAARDHGVLVSGTAGRGAPTAELTWALILGLVRHVREEDAAVRAGGWQQGVGGDLEGRRLGLLGLGRLGRRVAAVGRAFGMDVVAWSENLRAQDAAAVGVARVERDELLRTAHVVSIHLRLSDRTRGLLGAVELELMRPDALLINTSRGPIVEEAALVQALHHGSIAGAGLDVFDVEPLPADHPLRTAPRVLLTPHVGYVTEASFRLYFEEAVQDIEAFLDGAPVRLRGS
jgi:phosphoglycerate dehydrogenase-like enzyme